MHSFNHICTVADFTTHFHVALMYPSIIYGTSAINSGGGDLGLANLLQTLSYVVGYCSFAFFLLLALSFLLPSDFFLLFSMHRRTLASPSFQLHVRVVQFCNFFKLFLRHGAKMTRTTGNAYGSTAVYRLLLKSFIFSYPSFILRCHMEHNFSRHTSITSFICDSRNATDAYLIVPFTY